MSEKDILAYNADKYRQRLDAEPGDKPNADMAMAIEREAAAEDAAVEDQTADNAPLEPAVENQPAPARKVQSASSALKTVTHKVNPGETLASIAKKYDVSPEEIKEWNNMTRNSIRTGQMLRITTTPALAKENGAREVADAPAPRAPRQENTWKKESQTSSKSAKKNNDAASASAKSGKNKKNSKKNKQPAAPTSHSVKSGENLTTIAKKYGTTVSELKRANGLDGDELHPGDKLTLPGKGKAVSKSKKSSGKSSGKGSKSSKKSKKKKR